MNHPQKTILLLGGSHQQLVAIRAANDLGLRTVLCDYLPDNPGQYEVDKYYCVSTTDVEAVYEVAKQERVDGILAYASDPAALPAAIVCERLGLPTNSAKSVAILGVKHLFRKFLQENGFACPRHYNFSSEANVDDVVASIKHFSIPLIVKPTDSSGSKGVTKLTNLDNLKEAISYAEAYSRNKILIIEEYIERGFPYVIGGDIFVSEGRIVLFGEMACTRDFNGDSLIPVGKMKPSGLSAEQQEIVHNELQKIIDKLGIKFGELNIELIFDKNDQVYFLELGPRAGGNMIPIQLGDAFGVDLVKANIIAAMGGSTELKLNEQPGCFMHYVLHSYSDGIFDHIEYAPEIEKYIYRKCEYKKPGDKVESFDGANKALGIIFLHFDTPEQMHDFSNRRQQLVIPVIL